MRVKTLKCTDFRNIESSFISPCEEMNVICGENAQGKTNLIEAVWLFTGAKSFRSGKDSEFIKFGVESAKNELCFYSGGIENDAVMEFGERRKAILNENALSSPSKLAGVFRAVIFSPNDLSIVKEGPSVRRKFIDTAIGQLYPNYISFLRNYRRALEQRNKTIKEYRFDGSLSVMLDVFENEIAEYGKKIIQYRKRFLEVMSGFLPSIYEGISGGREKLETVYLPCCDGDLIGALKAARKEDMFTGTTSKGPHRDDIDFKINGISARPYGSQGQQRSIAISLKLAEAEVINSVSEEYPVFLLDDVMSELDPNRQDYILNRIKGMQTFLTCCDPTNINNLESGKIFRVKNGRVEN